MQENTSNLSFKVKPVNSFTQIEKYFNSFFKGLLDPKVGSFKNSYEEEQEIEMVQVKENQLDSLGFIPAHANYLLGLGIQYPDVTKIYPKIISVADRFDDGPIRGWSYLEVDAHETGQSIGLAPVAWDHSTSWIAVIRKKN